MKNRKILILPLIVVIAGAGYFLLRRNGEAADNIISFSGNIEMTTVEISFKVPGRLVSLQAEEGDSVSAEDVIARLDSEQLERQRDRVVAALDGVEARRAELESLIRFQRESMAAQTEQRNAEIAQAEAVLKELLSGSRNQEVEAARASVRQVEAEFERARLDWERSQELYRNEDISTATFERSRAVFFSVEAMLKQAQEKLALVEEGPRQENIDVARSSLARAKAGLKQVEAVKFDIQRSERSVRTLEAEKAGRQAELALIDTQLTDLAARSPVSGVVLKKMAESGEVVAAGSSVVTIGDLARPWVRGYVGETELGRVKIGSAVRVTSDSFPGREYLGKVSYISSEAEFTPKQIETREERVKLVYRVKVDIENPNQELKLNMPVDAEILLEEKETR